MNAILSALSRALSSLGYALGGIPKAYAPSSPPNQSGTFNPPTSSTSQSSSALLANALGSIGSLFNPAPLAKGATPGQSSIPSSSGLSYAGNSSTPMYAGNVSVPGTFNPLSQIQKTSSTASPGVSSLGGYSAPTPTYTPPAPTLPAGGFSSTVLKSALGGSVGGGTSPVGSSISSNVGGGGSPGYVSGGTGISGQSAPVGGTAVPPPPVSINTPAGQFEAIVKALQKSSPGGYIQTPLESVPAYGPGYGMGRTLKRLQEYQGMYR